MRVHDCTRGTSLGPEVMGDEVTVEVDARFATCTPVLIKIESSAKWHAAQQDASSTKNQARCWVV